MQKRNTLSSPRLTELKKKNRKAFWIKTSFTIFLFFLIIFGLVMLSRIPDLNIKKVTVVGNKIIDSDVIINIANKELAGKYLWLFPKTNALIYPKDAIKSELVKDIKRLNTISFSQKTKSVLEIDVTEREGKYTWCGDVAPEVTPTTPKCYFLDDTGYVFDDSPYFSPNVYFDFYGDLGEGSASPIGFSFSPNIFWKLTYWRDSFEEMGFKTSSVFVKSDGTAEFSLLSNSSPSKAKIMLETDTDVQKTSENLQAAITTEPLQTDLKTKYNSLLYIDLRYGNKVYYKFQ